eukprot:TRINITY_DN22906_c0_g1_i1.p1 TRINITY_DN22906_c0_g1~~TRINITY_DN22906_c0_g1_i1.p1  ORF type:complete len:570 (-),score=87.86 TRINITY_DN22906_c0_g1_i1:93-1802(-)
MQKKKNGAAKAKVQKNSNGAAESQQAGTTSVGWHYLAAGLLIAVVAIIVKVAWFGPAHQKHEAEDRANQEHEAESEPKGQNSSHKRLEELPTVKDLDWRVVSENPRIYVRDDFLLDEECEILKKQVSGRLEPAKVVQETENKHDTQMEVRNNRQIWLSYEEERDTPALHHIIKRLHRGSRLPEDDAEALQIGHYGVGQKYELHQDSDPAHDVARPATMIVYLSDTEEGGETLFPREHRGECTRTKRKDKDGNLVDGIKLCCDRDDLLRIKPKKGRAVLFFNHDMTGQKDFGAEHAACPVKRGEKWIAQRWFRYQPYQRLVHPADWRFEGFPGPGLKGLASELRPGNMEPRTLSQKHPSIYLIDDFLSSEEIRQLMELGQRISSFEENGMTRRWTTFEQESGSPELLDMIKRMHRTVLVPEAHSEPLQLGSYKAGEWQPYHVDSADDDSIHRPWTLLVYLTGDGTLGSEGEGATIFLGPQNPCGTLSLAECCALGARHHLELAASGKHTTSAFPLMIPPKAGRAVFFRSLTTSGALDASSTHGSCPAGPAGKWIAQKFFRKYALQGKEPG